MKTKAKFIVSLFIAAVTAITISAFKLSSESCSVTGKIKDKSTKEALAFVNVELLDASGKSITGAMTGFDGIYTIRSSAAGTFNIRASFVGYKSSLKKDITLSAGKTIVVDFDMESSAILMEALEIKQMPVVKDNADKEIRSEEIISYDRTQATPAESQSKAEGAAGRKLSTTNYSWSTPDFNTEQYDYIAENNFKNVRNNPLSTFSIDVDAASYSNIRRFINTGALPPVDAVRIEEMVNYFTYTFSEPKDGAPFSVYTEAAPCPWSKEHRLAVVALQGKKIATENLPPANLVFLIDVSGSMMEANKLPLVKKSLQLLVKQLRPQDRVAITVYAGNAGLVLPSTSGSEKEKIMEAINGLEAGGSTAGGAGIKLAYKVAKENFNEEGNNRVILCTDGDFNVGVSSDGELVRMIEEKRGTGIFLSVLGFGTGNYKDSKMEKLADKGNGNYAYIDNIMEAKKVFVNEIGGTLMTIAKDVKVQIEFNPEKVKEYKLIGYENRILNDEDFNDDKKDAGEMGSGHRVVALYEIVPVGSSTGISIDPLKYQTTDSKSPTDFSDEMMTVKTRYKEPQGSTSKLMTQPVKWSNPTIEKMSDNLKFACAVAEFGLILRNSAHKGKSSYDQVLNLARASKDKDEQGYRSEFVRLVEAAKLLDNRKIEEHVDYTDVVRDK
jgi:Ca-activated chloride channel family protein